MSLKIIFPHKLGLFYFGFFLTELRKVNYFKGEITERLGKSIKRDAKNTLSFVVQFFSIPPVCVYTVTYTPLMVIGY